MNRAAYGGGALLLALVTLGCTSAERRAAPAGNAAGPAESAAPNVAAALRHYERQLVAKHSDNLHQRQYDTALRYWQSGDAARCQAVLEQIVRDNPHHRDAALLLAELHLWNQQPQRALETLEPLRTARADDASLNHTLGLVHEALGRTTMARAYYQRAVELDPSNEVYLFSLDASRASATGGTQTSRRDNLVAQHAPRADTLMLAAHHSAAVADPPRAVQPQSPHSLRSPQSVVSPQSPEGDRAAHPGVGSSDAASHRTQPDLEPNAGQPPLRRMAGTASAALPQTGPATAAASPRLEQDHAADSSSAVTDCDLALAGEPELLPGLQGLVGRRSEPTSQCPVARKPLRLLR